VYVEDALPLDDEPPVAPVEAPVVAPALVFPSVALLPEDVVVGVVTETVEVLDDVVAPLSVSELPVVPSVRCGLVTMVLDTVPVPAPPTVAVSIVC
jgi:hypothetical protein